MDYNHKEIEKKWQNTWEENKTFEVKDKQEGKDNEFILVEFAYPSGNLHVGHWYAFAVTDIYAKYRRMIGKNVMFPFGFDSFGLPAENAAIKHKLDPKEWTYSNIEHMKKQVKSMGTSFDWSREVITSDPEYYKWTQWIFTKMFENGLAYKKKATVNWDPIDKTVLANEQVMADGTAERSGAIVEKKEIEQWFLKITDYAERLCDDLDKLNWPSEIKEMQKNWIGKSHGAEIEFKVRDSESVIKIFTTRPDTLFGATYMVLAPEHELVQNLREKISNFDEVEKYISEAKAKSEIDRTRDDKEKTGVELKGIRAVNPANQKEIPIFVADYVLANYGTGAIMAVPAHDERDYEFARKFGIEIICVIKPSVIRISDVKKIDEEFDSTKLLQEKLEKIIKGNESYSGDGQLINSAQFDGLSSDEAAEKITKFVGGEMKTTFKLRDWSVGRQRYWGCPVPIVYDPEGNPHPVPEKNLPWILPTDVDHTPTGEAPLAKSSELKERTEKIFGKGWTPEVETLDTFVDSSWYFLRYLDPKNEKCLADFNKVKNWMPVNFYSGGAEHTNLHLLYSRFFYKFLYDLKIVPTDEPYQKRLNRSLILGPDGNKMSKSKGNVIDPDEIVERLGADTVRLYLAFIGPYNECSAYPWDPNGVVGVRRFLERVWRLSNNLSETSSEKIKLEINKLIKNAGEDYEKLKFNTVVSGMMSFINVTDKEKISKEDFSKFIQVLAPHAPHIAEELWSRINKNIVMESTWPKYDEKLIQDQSINIAIQVNGKVRSEIEIKPDANESEIKESVLKMPEIIKWTEGKDPKKFLYIKGKIINIVV